MINAINVQQHVNNITTTNLQATVAATMTTLAGQVFFYIPFLFILLTNIYIDYAYGQQQQQQPTATTTTTDRRQQLPPPNLSQEVFVLFFFISTLFY
jgi:hypothetical protein